MAAKKLPGLDTLGQTPKILKSLLKGTRNATLDWKPAPDRWSVSEVLPEFKRLSAESVAFLRTLPPEAAARGAHHPELGQGTLG